MARLRREKYLRPVHSHHREDEDVAEPTEQKRAGPSTRAVHAGAPAARPGDPVSMPIVQSSTFINDVVPDGDVLYTRYGNNPTQEALAARLAALEGAEAALAVSSGMVVARYAAGGEAQGRRLDEGRGRAIAATLGSRMRSRTTVAIVTLIPAASPSCRQGSVLM